GSIRSFAVVRSKVRFYATGQPLHQCQQTVVSRSAYPRSNSMVAVHLALHLDAMTQDTHNWVDHGYCVFGASVPGI
ncbi:hypothetical protein, partial [Ruegeria sp. HKCCA4812]|uniref:hypothetical protein n=1 Tax=Ruegeria sp. HKCCA4812 TaxID=2682993 RepID=UPI001C2C0C08